MPERNDLELVEAINRSIAQRFGGDHCFAINHLMRVPGTTNWPTEAKIKRGRKPSFATILQPDTGKTWTPEEAAKEFTPIFKREERPDMRLDDAPLLTADGLLLDADDPIRSLIDHPTDEDGSRAVLRCAGAMHRAGFSKAEIEGIIANPENACSAHIFRDGGDRRYRVKRVLKKVYADATVNGQQGPDDRGAGSNAGEAGEGSQRPALAFLDLSELAKKEVPPRRFAIERLFLAGSLAALTGPGATGKSLLMQQAATAVSAGKALLGMKTTQGNAAYYTAEDDARELHEREVAICKLLGTDLAALDGKLFLAPMIELTDKALVRAGRYGDKLVTTELLAVIRQSIEDHGLKFLALDNAGHFYGADENVRAHVVTFLGLLNKLALETDCAIVLISHPNKSGSTYSGVTAWQNQIRVQAHLSKPSNEPDSNVRELRLEKANYAPPGPGIRMLWHHGAFALESDVPADDPDRNNAIQLRQNDIFYACLAAATAREQSASAGKSSPYYAPRLFAPMTEAQGMTEADLERTMHRLLSAGTIETGTLPFNRPSSRNKAEGLRLTGRRQEDDNEPPM
jgi:RecA-family ATPase